jgi:hypothetical protein
MASVALLDRVQRLLRTPDRSEEERVHEAVDVIAEEVDEIGRRLRVIDPEWELVARQEMDISRC